MELENEFGQVIHVADNLTLKEMVDMGLVVVLADKGDVDENCWVPTDQTDEE